MEDKMKAVVIYEAGGPDKLIYTEVPKPSVKPGWSLVKIKGFGINHSEIFTRKGQSPSVRFPRILGIECVGVIEETTESDRLPVGAKVISIMGEMGRDFDGSYAEYVLLPNKQIHPVETDIPWEILAAIPETYYTAYGSMKNLRIEEKDRILVRGGTSGVGIAFVKLVKAKFPEVQITGSSRKEDKRQLMLDSGYDDVVIEKEGILQTDMMFDKILDLVGPSAIRDTFSHTAEGGIVCVTGLLGGKWTIDDLDPIMEIPANGYLTGFYSGNVDGERLQEMLEYITEYKVDTVPEKVFKLSEVPEAHRYLESSGSFGKTVVVIE